MASLFTLPNGTRRIQFMNGAGRRQAIYLNDTLLADAQRIKTKVESILSANLACQALSPAVATWLADIPDTLYEKLEKVGLVPARQQHGDAAAVLGPFIKSYIAQRSDVKGSTAITYGNVYRNLIDHFGERKRLDAITEGDADKFRVYLTTLLRKRKRKKATSDNEMAPAREKRPAKKLALNTVNKRCQIAKLFFKAAVRQRLIRSNPFDSIKGATVKANRERDHFINAPDAQRLIDAAPDAQWRLIIALSRFGGLRCPSEHLALKWNDVLWDQGRIVVHSPKTEHRPGQEMRVIPMFPELTTALSEAQELAPDGAEFVINRYRDASQNLRTQFLKIIKRAGLKPWPRLFHNLRASRQTELSARHPIHVVCEWLGNSRLIAQEHYLRVTDDDFEMANQGVWRDAITTQQNKEFVANPCQPVPKKRRIPRKTACFPGNPKNGEWSLLDSNQ